MQEIEEDKKYLVRAIVWEIIEGKISKIKIQDKVWIPEPEKIEVTEVKEPEDFTFKNSRKAQLEYEKARSEIQKTIKCITCGEIKPEENYNWTDKDHIWRKTKCKKCTAIYMEKYHKLRKGTDKRCSRCREIKPLTEFHKNKTASDGFQSHCKPCRNEMNRIRKQRKKGKTIPEPVEDASIKYGVRTEELGEIVRYHNGTPIHETLLNKILETVDGKWHNYIDITKYFVSFGYTARSAKNTRYKYFKYVRDYMGFKLESTTGAKAKYRFSKIIPDMKISDGEMPLTGRETTDRKALKWNLFKSK